MCMVHPIGGAPESKRSYEKADLSAARPKKCCGYCPGGGLCPGVAVSRSVMAPEYAKAEGICPLPPPQRLATTGQPQW